jgi:hypothetical protein
LPSFLCHLVTPVIGTETRKIRQWGRWFRPRRRLFQGNGVAGDRHGQRNHRDVEHDGNQVQGGLALKYNPGALLLAGVLSGAHGWYDTTRLMNSGGFNRTAQGDQEIDVLQGRFRAS